jgi:DNA-binding CsgD family transcriptional regulator
MIPHFHIHALRVAYMTSRQKQILVKIANDEGRKEIAYSLGITVKCVDWHIKQMRKDNKLGGIASMVRYAIRLGLVSLCCMLMVFSVEALQNVTLSWGPSLSTNVTGYKVYWGSESGFYTNQLDAGNVLTATVSNLVEGVTYYFVATAYNNAGMESDFSNEASYSVPENNPGTNFILRWSLGPCGNI